MPVNLMIKTATAGGFSPSAIALCRWGCLVAFLFAALQVPAFRAITRAQWPTRKDAGRAMLIGLLFFGPSHLVYYAALTRTSSVEGTVLGTTAPVWTALMAFLFLSERVRGRRATAIGLGFIGAWVVSIGFAVPELRAGHTAGNLLYLFGVLAESAAGVFSAAIVRRSSGITTLAFQVLGAVVTLILAPLLLPGLFAFSVGTSLASVAAMAYLVLLPGLFCFSVWYMLVERTPLSLMVLSILLQPPLSAMLAYFVLREPITPQIVIGAVLILSALVLGATERRQPAAAA